MKKRKIKTSHIALLVILVVIIVIGYQKYGGVREEAEEEAAEEAEARVEEEVVRAAEPAKEAQPLYPDLCYAAGGKPVKASDGCDAGEKNLGDVPGFKVPHICCTVK